MNFASMIGFLGLSVFGLSAAHAQDAQIEFGARQAAPAALEIATDEWGRVSLIPVTLRSGDAGQTEVVSAVDEAVITVLPVGILGRVGLSSRKGQTVGVGLVIGTPTDGLFSEVGSITGLTINADFGTDGNTIGLGYGVLLTDKILQGANGLAMTYSRLYDGTHRGASYGGVELNMGMFFMNATVGVMKKIAAENRAAANWLGEVQFRVYAGWVPRWER